MRERKNNKGILYVLGTGITGLAHITKETESIIAAADTVFYVVGDELTSAWIKKRKPAAVSLSKHTREGVDRRVYYDNMVDEILTAVRQDKTVAVVYNGHPGVCVYSSHQVIRKAKQAGYEARMLPGIPADSCLIADIGIDPVSDGWQAYDASVFLSTNKAIDSSTPLVLWQIGIIGNTGFSPGKFNAEALAALKRKLGKYYPATHRVCVYEASRYPLIPPVMDWMALADLSSQNIPMAATLYIPKSSASISDEENAALIKNLSISR